MYSVLGQLQLSETRCLRVGHALIAPIRARPTAIRHPHAHRRPARWRAAGRSRARPVAAADCHSQV